MTKIREMLDSYGMRLNEPIEMNNSFNPLTFEHSLTLMTVKTRKRITRIVYLEDSIYTNVKEMLEELYKEVRESC